MPCLCTPRCLQRLSGSPTEKSLISHLQWLRELADLDILTGIAWTDTRDMLADGLTKGAVDRHMIHQAMDGQWVLTHEPKLWQSTLRHTHATTAADRPRSSNDD